MNSPDLSPGLLELLRSSPSLQPLLTAAARAATSSAPILILGEAGTGRSTVARALHAASPRATGPLIEVDISAVPSTLFESELFGHRPGAFTGADLSVAGRVERAEGGTLLLDHVEEIPVAAQPKLLRILAEGRFTPLGGAEKLADVRFLGIASSDLPERAAAGSFRQDLFYRLEVVTLLLPPLRERRQDLAPLIDYFLRDLEIRFALEGLELEASARDWMVEYDWPGNLRELRNVLERALIAQGSRRLRPAQPERAGGPPETLQDLERKHIQRTLAYTRGHQGRAAEVLGISRKTLWEKRRKYGIP